MAKEPTARQLFVERMKREGREAEWHATLKKVMDETGKKFGQAAPQAMREMGYEGPKEERKLYDEHLANLHKTSAERALEKEVATAREDAKVARFEQAVALLPNNAPKAVELAWIEAHPAMARKRRARLVPLWWDKGTLEDLCWWLRTCRESAGPKDPLICSLQTGERLAANTIATRWSTALRKALGEELAKQVSIHAGEYLEPEQDNLKAKLLDAKQRLAAKITALKPDEEMSSEPVAA